MWLTGNTVPEKRDPPSRKCLLLFMVIFREGAPLP